MFTSFDENAFWTAVNEKDLLRLKVNTVSAIRNDPTFTRGETDKVISILEEKVPEIFVQERMLESEERLSKDKWDKGYFTRLTYWFQENFAKSRLEHIKEVGRTVHQDTARKYAQSMSQKSHNENKTNADKAVQTTVQSSNPTQAPEKKKTIPIIGAIAAVVALVLVVVLLIKALSK